MFGKHTALWLLASALVIATGNAHGQSSCAYLQQNAVRVSNPATPGDSVYNLLAPYQVLMMGEMHGTNEPAEMVTGLTDLLARKGDSISLGLEIPPGKMAAFLSSRTDSSIYQSYFFSSLPVLDGRQSYAWARIISKFKNTPNVQIFFFDADEGDEKNYDRDSMMYVHIKKQMLLHPRWRVVTLSGNAHAMIRPSERKMAGFLKEDKDLQLSSRICALDNYYQQGACRANFGHGLEERKLSRPLNDFDTALSFDKYIILLSSKTTFPYTAIYYTRDVTPATMVKGDFDLPALKKELAYIHERDQKTRSRGDSTAYTRYIDSSNLLSIEAIIAKYGWPGKTLAGGIGNQAAFLVIQHADIGVQEKYFPLMEQSVQAGESRAGELAMLQDRILMRRGKKQVYGSQVTFNKTTGAREFWPIEDEKNVNIRRAQAGLQPLEEYAKYFGIDYKLPAD